MVIAGIIAATAAVGLSAYGYTQQRAGIREAERGAVIQREAHRRQIQAQQRAERLRERQMELDAARKRRETVRNMLIARSTALANATEAGAQYSSALPGAFAGIAGQAGRQIQTINQNQMIGAGMFDANQDLFQGQLMGAYANNAGQSSIALGGGLMNLGGTILNSIGPIERVGTTLFQPRTPQV